MNNSPEFYKQRTIEFASSPDGQLERALVFLSKLPECMAELGDSPNTLVISYDLRHHTLEKLEALLSKEGFQLEQTMLLNIERNIIHYSEDTICHNMDVPAHPTKKNERGVFVQAYEQQPHGDQDDTPPEIQEFK